MRCQRWSSECFAVALLLFLGPSPLLCCLYHFFAAFIHTATTSEIPTRGATSDSDPSPPAFAKQAQSITDRALPCATLNCTVLSLALEQHIHPRHQGPHNTRQPNTTRRSTITSSCQHLRAHTQSPHSPANSRCNGCRRARYARPPCLHPIAHCPPCAFPCRACEEAALLLFHTCRSRALNSSHFTLTAQPLLHYSTRPAHHLRKH